jgi:hypothetical protein
MCEVMALRAGWRVEKITTDAFYTLQKNGYPDLAFPANRWGTYSMPVSEFKASFQDLCLLAYAVDLSTPPQHELLSLILSSV